ncbi:tetratricopeptide repeat protein [Desulfosarcina ovata]|uniref:protein O-GlcNAc transferase n=1 Tax=Desulfosarcina ovata subsp. ovata TaxID=2752305 RepID=A0A5K8A797_9BACT|nr:tetratricopeptide repeat protein [Desulfosarcina ovata]BBO88349.1 hypothetical protein DSCOOX_15290 [Desulfosarcina ovata subsp. ovata]
MGKKETIDIHHFQESDESLQTTLEKALTLHKSGHFRKAGKLYADILSVSPNYPAALHLFGILQYDMGRAEAAIPLIQAAIIGNPEQPLYYLDLGNAYLETGDYNHGVRVYRQGLSKFPSNTQLLYNLSITYVNHEKWEEAEDVLNHAIRIDPEWGDAWALLGKVFLVNKKVDQAISCYQRAIEIDGKREDFHFCLGNAWLEKKEFHLASMCYRRAINLKKNFYDAINNLGVATQKSGDVKGAIACYKKAISISPQSSDAYVNLANVLLNQGYEKEVIRLYERAIEVQPDSLPILINLGKLYLRDQNYEKSINCLSRADAISPNDPQTLYLIGRVLLSAGEIRQAIDIFKKVLAIDPGMVSTYISLGNAYRIMESMEEAILNYQKALKHDKRSEAALTNLAIAYRELGDIQSSHSCLDSILEMKDDLGARVKKTMLLPIIYPSNPSIDHTRQKFEKELYELASTGKTLADANEQIGLSNFIVALHGREDERQLRHKIYDFYRRICPDLIWTAPNLKRTCVSGKIRIGFLSNFFRDHTIGRLYRGIIENIDKTKFEVVVFRFDRHSDETAQAIHASADKVVILKKNLKADREYIAGCELDVLFFPEIGMHPLTYYLSFSRMAPVQCKKGFPVTSGVPTIDYFISHAASEPANAQDYYTEELIQLESTGYYYYRPKKPGTIPNRNEYGLPESAKLYACLQSPFKIHPEHDAAIAEILRRDNDGILLLMEGKYHQWKTLLIERFRRTLGPLTDRVYFIPSLDRDQFVALFLMADAVIDSIYFSGGNTSLECFAMGVPVVTWPSPMLPGRLTYGFYKQMNIMTCVASDMNQYVELAIRMANDLSWKDSICREIESKSSILFENISNVKELEETLEKMVAKCW